MGLPAIEESENSIDEMMPNISALTMLNYNQKKVLAIMIDPENMTKTDIEIGRLAGVADRTIRVYKNDPHFLACLSELTKRYGKAEVPKAIRALTRQVEKGDRKAIELLIKYTGDYIPTQRNENLNANLESNVQNPLELLDSLLISLGKSGVTADYILNRYIELKNQNAF